MSTAEGLETHVPYLRRFARALTGSQASGDACVVAALGYLSSAKPPIRLPASRSTGPSSLP